MSAQPSHTLHDRFSWGLELGAGNPALVVDRRRLTFGELHELALTWAGTMLAESGGRLDRVGILATRSVEAYAGMLAALYAGATAVPLNPRFPAERTQRMLDAARPDAIIADAQGARVAAELAGALPAGLPVLQPSADRGTALRPDPALALAVPRPATPGDVAYILFTSGSTGRPKGVPVTHGNVDHYLRAVHARYGFTTADVFSQTFDLTFDLAVFDLFAAWGAGASVVSTPQQAFFDLPEFVARHGLTVWFSTPSTIAAVRRLGHLRPEAFPSLRWSLFCGEPLTLADADAWLAAAPKSTLENLYGPTELTISCSVHRYEPDISPGLAVNGFLSIGAVHEGMAHLICDEHDRPAIEGELCVTGPQMFPGYLDPADDTGRFLEYGGRRWYRTGDRVRRLPDGELGFLGRQDSQVKIHGQRVELAEIDWGMRRCPGVAESATVVVEVDGACELYTFYTGQATPRATLVRAMRGIFPDSLVPRYLEHVAEFPLNSNGKTDRKELACLARQRVAR
ncbi:AMP-binding protein [Microbispora sp. CA-135349]|uniref:AMP-binding protein n=1 Tax=Microbispora sp. CA-135349 TaxID=3239953 RepID=UPI003D92583D